MALKVLSSTEELQLVHDTLRVRDPGRVTVAVGSVAINASLVQAHIESPIGIEDVDVLCPEDFFDELLRSGPYLENIRKFQVRWPYGRLKERGATNQSIDIYPASPDLLPLTACHSMSDLWYPITYESCQPNTVEASGIKCLRIGNMLEWLAIIGRDKDIDMVEKVLPLAIQAQLVTRSEKDAILIQLSQSLQLKESDPARHYARVDL